MAIDHLVDSNRYTDLLHLMNNECFTVLLSMQSNKGKRKRENINNNAGRHANYLDEALPLLIVIRHRFGKVLRWKMFLLKTFCWLLFFFLITYYSTEHRKQKTYFSVE
jgi:hypothetical protein